VVSGVAGLGGGAEDASGLVEGGAGLSAGGLAGALDGAGGAEDSTGAVVAVSALAPVLAPDHQSVEARLLGEAFM